VDIPPQNKIEAECPLAAFVETGSSCLEDEEVVTWMFLERLEIHPGLFLVGRIMATSFVSQLLSMKLDI